MRTPFDEVAGVFGPWCELLPAGREDWVMLSHLNISVPDETLAVYPDLIAHHAIIAVGVGPAGAEMVRTTHGLYLTRRPAQVDVNVLAHHDERLVVRVAVTDWSLRFDRSATTVAAYEDAKRLLNLEIDPKFTRRIL